MLRRGRFEHQIDPLASEYTSSMKSDPRIFAPVVQINMAHTIMLAERNLIPAQVATQILRALYDLHQHGIGKLSLRPELEDIHTSVEEFVAATTGDEIGGWLNLAKSRNDQVATAIRMVLRKDLLETRKLLLELIDGMISVAEKNANTIMPGYTHLQTAQPTTFAHYLACYISVFLRDVHRLTHAIEQMNSCPMGACALAGTSFQIDRIRVARLLGFKRTEENAMDAVSSRDFALQAISTLALLMTNLSRLAEELILWSSQEFGMIEIPEEFTATSSIMPQKKNPVVAEIVRAKTGDVIGDLVASFTIMKALPQSYSLDLQNLTPCLWNALDTTQNSLKVMTRLMVSIKPKPEIMRKRAEEGFATATELANILARNNLPFRHAHVVVGRMVANAIRDGKPIQNITVEDLRVAGREILGTEIEIKEEEFKRVLDIEKCLSAYSSVGSAAPKFVKVHLDSMKKTAKTDEKLNKTWERALSKSEKKLLAEVKRRLK